VLLIALLILSVTALHDSGQVRSSHWSTLLKHEVLRGYRPAETSGFLGHIETVLCTWRASADFTPDDRSCDVEALFEKYVGCPLYGQQSRDWQRFAVGIQTCWKYVGLAPWTQLNAGNAILNCIR